MLRRIFLVAALVVGALVAAGGTAGASTSQPPPPGVSVYHICVRGTQLCIMPANSNPKSGITRLKVVNVNASAPDSNHADWRPMKFGKVTMNNLVGVSKAWIKAHLGWGFYQFHWAYNPSLCIGLKSFRDPTVVTTTLCATYTWIWKPGWQMFLFVAARPHPGHPTSLYVLQAGSSTTNQLRSGAPVSIAPYRANFGKQRWVQIFHRVIPLAAPA